MVDERLVAKERLTFIKNLYPLGFRHDAQTLVKLAGSLMLSNALSLFFISAVSLVFMDRLGNAELNASALALTTHYVTSKSILLGLNFGCDTLLPQYYGLDKRKVGLVLQRGVIMIGYGSFISWTLLLNAVSTDFLPHLPDVL